MVTRNWLVAAMTSMALALGGCQTTGGGSGGGGGYQQASGGGQCQDPSRSQAEQQLCQDNAIFNDTVLGGALTWGAVAGGGTFLGCLALGEKLGKCAMYGGIATVVGGAAGGIDGYLTAKRQEANKQQVREIELVTQDVRNENQKLAESVRTSQQVVAENRGRLTTAQRQLRQGQITLADAQAERTRAEQNRQTLDSMINGLEQRKDSYRQAQSQSGQSSREFSNEIAKMERQIAQLRQQRDALDKALVTTSIG